MSVSFAAAQAPQHGSALTQIAPAETGLEVVIVDESGAPIRNAQVFISDGKGEEFSRGRSDSNGEFRSQSLHAGSYVLTTQATGFQTRSQSVRIGAQESVKFKVELAVSAENMGFVTFVEHATLEPTLRTVPDFLPVPVESPIKDASVRNKNSAAKSTKQK